MTTPAPTTLAPVSLEEYRKAYVITMEDAWAADQVEFYQNAGPPETPEVFAAEACWVVLNSGFRNTVARKIWPDLWPAIQVGQGLTVFRNDKKIRAMDTLWSNRTALHTECIAKITEGIDAFLIWCQTLDGYGPVISQHLAKNFGLATGKNDIWLERLSQCCGESTNALCQRLSMATGHRLGTVDFVWWYVLSRGHLKIGPNGRTFTAEANDIPPSTDQPHCAYCPADWVHAVPVAEVRRAGILPEKDHHLATEGGWFALVCDECHAKIKARLDCAI